MELKGEPLVSKIFPGPIAARLDQTILDVGFKYSA